MKYIIFSVSDNDFTQVIKKNVENLVDYIKNNNESLNKKENINLGKLLLELVSKDYFKENFLQCCVSTVVFENEMERSTRCLTQFGIKNKAITTKDESLKEFKRLYDYLKKMKIIVKESDDFLYQDNNGEVVFVESKTLYVGVL